MKNRQNIYANVCFLRLRFWFEIWAWWQGLQRVLLAAARGSVCKNWILSLPGGLFWSNIYFVTSKRTTEDKFCYASAGVQRKNIWAAKKRREGYKMRITAFAESRCGPTLKLLHSSGTGLNYKRAPPSSIHRNVPPPQYKEVYMWRENFCPEFWSFVWFFRCCRHSVCRWDAWWDATWAWLHKADRYAESPYLQ